MTKLYYTPEEARMHSKQTAREQAKILEQNIRSINKKKKSELSYV